jgi:hypothetical protein
LSSKRVCQTGGQGGFWTDHHQIDVMVAARRSHAFVVSFCDRQGSAAF